MVKVSVTAPGSTSSAGETEKLISSMCRRGGSVPVGAASDMAKPPAHKNARAKAASSAANLRMKWHTSFGVWKTDMLPGKTPLAAQSCGRSGGGWGGMRIFPDTGPAPGRQALGPASRRAANPDGFQTVETTENAKPDAHTARFDVAGGLANPPRASRGKRGRVWLFSIIHIPRRSVKPCLRYRPGQKFPRWRI